MSGEQEDHDRMFAEHVSHGIVPNLMARITELEAALAPFAKFWEAQRKLGPPTPQSGELFVVRTGELPIAITVEDLKTAARVSMRP